MVGDLETQDDRLAEQERESRRLRLETLMKIKDQPPNVTFNKQEMLEQRFKLRLITFRIMCVSKKG